MLTFIFHAIDDPLNVVGAYGGTCGGLGNDMLQVRDGVVKILDLIRPPLPSYGKRIGKWWTWRDTTSIHAFLFHMIPSFIENNCQYGHINAYGFERNHCDVKTVISQHSSSLLPALRFKRTMDFENLMSNAPLESVHRNMNKYFDDRHTELRRAQRKAAVESLGVLNDCDKGEGGGTLDENSNRLCGEEVRAAFRNLFIEPTEEELLTMNLPFPSFPNKDGWLSPLFLYLAFHGKREQAQANANAEEQYAFGEDPTLLEHLEMGEELTMRLDDDDSQDVEPCEFAATTAHEEAMNHDLHDEGQFLQDDEDERWEEQEAEANEEEEEEE